MKCPHCGAENPDKALFCAQCGECVILEDAHQDAEQGESPAPSDAVAHEASPAHAVRATPVIPAFSVLDESVSDEEVSRLIDELPTYEAQREAEEQARREEEARLAMEAKIAQMSDIDEPDEGEAAAASDQTQEDLAPGIIPVSRTMLRLAPVELGEGEFVVRNTRDYDHDAQSSNVVSSADNFETIVDDKPRKRDARRDPYARSARKGRVPGEGNSRSKLRPLLAIFIIAIVLGGGGAVLTYGMEMWGGKEVPGVVGQSQANAEYMLADKGLKVTVKEEPADDAIGKVMAQKPEPGERVPEGSKVNIVVAVNRVIPDVVGQSEDKARTLLGEAGAERIVTITKPSSEAEGTVIEVSPEAGRTFVSRGDVILTVAGPYTVPDVIGKKETDATDTIKTAGLKADVTYVKSDKTVRTVVETEPAPGEVIDEGGTVHVRVSSPYPSDVYHLAEFFGHSSQDVDTFLQKKGFAFGDGFMDSLGNALATYTSEDKGNITFSSQPYSHTLSLPKEGSSNVLATGAPIAGVRLDLPASLTPKEANRTGINEIAEKCGLTGLNDICDNKTITVPSNAKRIAATFMCASGKMDNLDWTVLIVSLGSQVRASVTCFKDGLYASSGLETFGGSLCQFEAYQEVYLDPTYQAAEPKKTETKDSDKKDSDNDKKDSDGDKKDSENAEKQEDNQENHQDNNQGNSQADNGGSESNEASIPQEAEEQHGEMSLDMGW